MTKAVSNVEQAGLYWTQASLPSLHTSRMVHGTGVLDSFVEDKVKWRRRGWSKESNRHHD